MQFYSVGCLLFYVSSNYYIFVIQFKGKEIDLTSPDVGRLDLCGSETLCCGFGLLHIDVGRMEVGYCF